MVRRVVRHAAEVAGDREAQALAATLGGSVRDGRRARRLTLEALADRVGISRARLAQLERGEGAGAPLTTWIALGIALQRPLAIAFTRPLGEKRGTSDSGHLEIQEHVLGLAHATGRAGTFELPTRPTDPSRSTDVGILDVPHRTRILAECWNTFGDLGAAVRATHRKAAEAAATWPDDRIATVWIVRASAANRQLLARFPHIVDATFPGSSRRWFKALTSPEQAPPNEPGIVWFDPSTGRLSEHRSRG
jgi:transcriptional regulator with XRE-family HTH domain